jgi:hypothetical protein
VNRILCIVAWSLTALLLSLVLVAGLFIGLNGARRI